MDISNYSLVKEVFKRIYERHRRIDILINSAGIIQDRKISFMTEDAWKRVIEVNLNGTFWAIKQASKYMIKNNGGVIVNLSSVASHKAIIGQVNYSSSKAGIEALTRVVALELASSNIRINSVSPGFIDTDMLSKIKEIDSIVEQIPLKRLGYTKEVADLVCFLISDKSSYITGQNFIIDGGLTI